MPKAQWTDDFLTGQRQVADAKGDAVIQTVFARGDIFALDRFMRQLVTNEEIPLDVPAEVRAFLQETSALPPWADADRLAMGARLFDVHGCASLAAIVCASLPQCYTMRVGVRILGLTTQLGVHANRRLHQTAAMVLDVMAHRGFEAHGQAIRQTQKVRLIHAAIRYGILRALGIDGLPRATGAQVPVLVKDAVRSVSDIVALHGFDWQIARDGMPINQEDQAFTLLTFGHVIPQAMRTMGIKLSDDEYEAFLHCWNVSGYILGVDEAMLAHTVADAEDLFARIQARQAGASPEGAELTHALLLVVEQKLLRARILHPLGPIFMRMLIGEQAAAWLGLHVRHPGIVGMLHRALVAAFRAVQFLTSGFSQSPVAGALAAKLGFRVMEYLCLITDDGKARHVAIPPGWR